jgi:hypothetical protein
MDYGFFFGGVFNLLNRTTAQTHAFGPFYFQTRRSTEFLIHRKHGNWNRVKLIYTAYRNPVVGSDGPCIRYHDFHNSSSGGRLK